MKVYISADIEGVTGSTVWKETELNELEYAQFQKQMTEEVHAAIRGAVAGGATEILLKDAHDSGRNILIEDLPDNVKIIRGWTMEPMAMVAGVDETFDRVIYIGYHSEGGSERNPLAHTLSMLADVKINGEYASEFLINTYAIALKGVPVAFVSGDLALTEKIATYNDNIVTYATKDGIGRATISVAPKKAVRDIEALVEQAMRVERESLQLTLPEKFEVELIYRDHILAYRNSHYPGAKFKAHNTVTFETTDFYEVLRLLQFLT